MAALYNNSLPITCVLGNGSLSQLTSNFGKASLHYGYLEFLQDRQLSP